MYRSLSFLIATIIAFTLVPATAMGDTATDATQRIKDRLTQVDALKSSGDVGEDARGYLSKRTTLGPRQNAIVDAENADRKILYQTVAGRTGQTVEDVGKQRAIQIAARARSGVWLQRPDGKWVQRP
jgi:uncharacterized protein YdbL (DUF1318 family)